MGDRLARGTRPDSCGTRRLAGVRVANRIERLGSVLIYAHHSLIVAVGAFGMIETPSPAVSSVIGGAAAAWVWSTMFLVFGLLALGCRFTNRHGIRWKGHEYRLDTTRSEALCIVCIGVALFLFSGLIAWSTIINPPPGPRPPGSIQTALALLSSSVFLPGVAALSLAMTRRERLRRTETAQHIMHQVAREVRRGIDEAN